VELSAAEIGKLLACGRTGWYRKPHRRQRKRYNDNLQDYNTYVQKFPNSI
jgi:hypothetical protein